MLPGGLPSLDESTALPALLPYRHLDICQGISSLGQLPPRASMNNNDLLSRWVITLAVVSQEVVVPGDVNPCPPDLCLYRHLNTCQDIYSLEQLTFMACNT